MGFFPIEKFQKLWSTWDLRGIVLFSLFLQSLLIMVASFRRKTANAKVGGLIWIAYLMADWAATFAVGLISHSQVDNSINNRTRNLVAFWAPFLLLHLGGPDTITAFAMEDNELWLRHLLQLGTQLSATGYVFYKSLPTNELMLPTILMFVAGLIKYFERTRSLYMASINKFRSSLLTEPDPGPNYAKLMEEYTMRKDARLPADIENIKEPEVEFEFSSNVPKDAELSELQMIQDAYKWYNTFKGLVSDLIFSIYEWRESREYFLNRNAVQAFRLVEIELNFFFEVIYTKMAVIHTWGGYFFRLICFGLVFVSFWLWYLKDKSHIKLYDIKLTYILLLGAIALDAIAFSKLLLSDWMIAHVKISGQESILKTLISKYLELSKPRWSSYTEKDKTVFSKLVSTVFCSSCSESKNIKTIPFVALVSRIFFRRWSENVQQYNLIDYSLNLWGKKTEFLLESLGLKDYADGFKYETQKWFSVHLRDSIFLELKEKAKAASRPADAEQICKARGEWVLQHKFSQNFKWTELETWLTKVDYDESLILWHIATEVCYNHDFSEDKKTPAGAASTGVEEEEKNRESSKMLSDYMLYLLLRQPKVMTAVAGIGQFRFRDTCAEAKKFFQSQVLDPEDKENRLRKACTKLLDVSTEIPPRDAKGDRSKSVLFEGCRLAKELIKLGKRVNKWQVICKVWVEMLSYAATNCSGNAHAAQLSKGGQLVTVVWLLMVHLGMGKRFLINEGNARAKLKIGR